MRRSQSLIEEDILKCLIFNGSLKISDIIRKVRISHEKSKKFLNNFLNNGLVKKTINDQTCFFTITSEGSRIVKNQF
jgi:predicted transcriptional regulator